MLTRRRTNLGMARVCVALDISKPRKEAIWIEFGDTNDPKSEVDEDCFWQKVTYEEIPSYCSSCTKMGHHTGECSKIQQEIPGCGETINAEDIRPIEKVEEQQRSHQAPRIRSIIVRGESGKEKKGGEVAQSWVRKLQAGSISSFHPATAAKSANGQVQSSPKNAEVTIGEVGSAGGVKAAEQGVIECIRELGVGTKGENTAEVEVEIERQGKTRSEPSSPMAKINDEGDFTLVERRKASNAGRNKAKGKVQVGNKSLRKDAISFLHGA